MSLGARIKRVFTHPYGACEQEGCDDPREMRWMRFCVRHEDERIRKAAQEMAEAKFNRDASVIAEGVLRALREERAARGERS